MWHCRGLSDDDDFDMYADEETKSRFTEYSMTSSVMHRNDKLQLLDEQFEKVRAVCLLGTVELTYADVPRVLFVAVCGVRRGRDRRAGRVGYGRTQRHCRLRSGAGCVHGERTGGGV